MQTAAGSGAAVQSDDRNTVVAMRSGADERILTRRGTGSLFLVLLSLQKLDVNFRAVDADKFASAIGQAGRRQQQKELPEIEALNGALDGKYGVVVRDGIQQTVAAPCPVNPHDTDAISTAERHALRCFVVIRHLSETRHDDIQALVCFRQELPQQIVHRNTLSSQQLRSILNRSSIALAALHSR
jgi:hypothetical protein